ncbi:response regulator transcription factor [Serratia sp. IR-2025]|uniref:response regulator transcription factor n=1 Tax=Serratia marcescens TaxID=615 RepID=UPI003879DF53
MKPQFIVAIQDTNRFFAYGVEQILRGYFTQRGLAVQFVSGSSHAVADLTVREFDKTWPLRPCRVFWWEEPTGMLISVRNTIPGGRMLKPACANELGVLGRKGSPAELLLLVESLCREMAKGRQQRAHCARCFQALTPREVEVLNCLRGEFGPSQVSRMLGLSPKTVSTHKRTAMRKLGVQRNSELYQWLRQGGLEFEKRTPS